MSLPNPEHEARAQAAEELLEAVAKASWDSVSARDGEYAYLWPRASSWERDEWRRTVSEIINAYEALRPEAEDGPWEWGTWGSSESRPHAELSEQHARAYVAARENCTLWRRRPRRRPAVPAGPWERVEVDG